MPPLRNAHYIGWWRYGKLCACHVRLMLNTMIWRTETRSAEISFGLIALGWWFVLWFSPAFDARNLYDYLSREADQRTWALLMGSLGLAQLALSWIPQHRMCVARATVWVWSAAVWSYIAWVSMLAVPVTTAAAAYSVLAFGSGWAFFRSIDRS